MKKSKKIIFVTLLILPVILFAQNIHKPADLDKSVVPVFSIHGNKANWGSGFIYDISDVLPDGTFVVSFITSAHLVSSGVVAVGLPGLKDQPVASQVIIHDRYDQNNQDKTKAFDVAVVKVILKKEELDPNSLKALKIDDLIAGALPSERVIVAGFPQRGDQPPGDLLVEETIVHSPSARFLPDYDYYFLTTDCIATYGMSGGPILRFIEPYPPYEKGNRWVVVGIIMGKTNFCDRNVTIPAIKEVVRLAKTPILWPVFEKVQIAPKKESKKPEKKKINRLLKNWSYARKISPWPAFIR